MYTKLNLLPAKVASKSSIRGDIMHLVADGKRTYATDSSRLLEVTATEPQTHETVYILADIAKKHKMPNKQIELNINELQANSHINTFPDVDKIINQEDGIEYVTFEINGELFGELIATMAKMNRYKKVKINVPIAKNRVIHLYADSDDNKQKAHGLQMPIMQR